MFNYSGLWFTDIRHAAKRIFKTYIAVVNFENLSLSELFGIIVLYSELQGRKSLLHLFIAQKLLFLVCSIWWLMHKF